MFPSLGVVRVPNLAQPENPPKIVHVPMGAPGKAQVMPHSPAEPSGTEGAADVHIGSLADGQQTELADLDDTATRRAKDQCVRSRLGASRREKKGTGRSLLYCWVAQVISTRKPILLPYHVDATRRS